VDPARLGDVGRCIQGLTGRTRIIPTVSPAAYLDEHPPRSPQFRLPRREQISGVTAIHTSEQVMDDIGPDTGVERLADVIAGRSDPGSYHTGGDSDTALRIVRLDAEAFQIAADGHNRHALSYSFACRTTDLHPQSVWTLLAMAIAGREIAAVWTETGFCVPCSARWLTNAQVTTLRSGPSYCPHGLRQGGLTTHGALQPSDRSDAWTRHPHRAALEQLLIDAIRTPTEGGLTVADLNEILAKLDKPRTAVARDGRDGTIYHLDGGWKHPLGSMDEVHTLLYLGVPYVGDNVSAPWLDALTTADPAKETPVELRELTADQIAQAVADEAARRMAG
jgi:hypothetical protein